MAQIIYVGSFNDGLYRSLDDGATFAQIWGVTNGENYIRGLATMTTTPGLDQVLIGCYGVGSGAAGSYAITTGGLYRLDHADATPLPVVHELTPFNSVEEILVLGSRIYVVGSIITINATTGVVTSQIDGVWVATVLGGPATNWTRLGAAALPTTAGWCSIAGKAGASAATDTLFVGSSTSIQGSTSGPIMYDHVMRSTNGGTTWVGITLLDAAIHNEVGGPGGSTWWYFGNTFGLLGKGSTMVVAQLISDPNDVNKLYLAGRAGAWFTRNALAANPDWYPSVQKMGVTINNAVVADPNTIGRVYVTNVDWVFFYSTNHLANVTQKAPPVPGAASAAGYSLALDTSATPSVVYCGVGDRDSNIAGAVYSNTDPTANAWAAVGDLVTAAGGARPFGMALLKITGTVNILAALAGSGVWRWNGTTWAKLTGAMYVSPTPDPKRHPILWISTNLAYCYDQDTGVWRGTTTTTTLDTWTKINPRTTANRQSGYLIVDPADTSRLFLSVDAGLFRLDGAATLAMATETAITGLTNPGPLDIDPNGILFVARPADAAGQAQMNRTANRSSASPVWADVADASYRGGSPFPNAIETTTDTYIYITEDGTGAMIGSAAGSILTNVASSDSAAASETSTLFTGGFFQKNDSDDAVGSELVTVGTSTIFSSDHATGTEGQNNPGGVVVVVRFVPKQLPPVRHVIHSRGGSDTPDVTNDWTATEVAPGGYWNAEGWIDARRALGKPDVYRAGAVWTMYLDDPNDPLWEGVLLDVVPTEQNEAHLIGRGWGQSPGRTVDRMNFVSVNYQDWVPEDSDPHNYNSDPAWQVDANGGRLLYTGHQGTAVNPNDNAGLVFWSEGCPVTEVSWVTHTQNLSGPNYALQVMSSKGPRGGRTIEGADIPLVDNDTRHRLTLSTPDGDQVGIRIIYQGAVATFALPRRARLTDLQVRGLAGSATVNPDGTLTYEMQTSDVVSVLFGKLGFDTWAVSDTGDNILPLDFKTGTYADALNYCAAFSGQTWLILSRAGKPYGRFRPPDVWLTTRDDGPTQLDPLTRYNQVVVRYLTTAHRQRQVVVTCEDLGLPDPFAGTTFTNAMTLEIVEQHHANPAIAQRLAERVLSIIYKERYTGSLDRAYLRSAEGQMVDARKARAGDLVVVEDAKPWGSATVTILDKTSSSAGASFNLAQNDPVLDQLLTHKAGLLGGAVP